MKIPQMIATELRRLTRTRMAAIALIALGVVPILYGGLYLWANQDPYEKLDQIPVALVVDDTGTTQQGTEENYGDEIADQLIEDGTFGWQRVSAERAKAGVANSDFDFSVTLPADFSAALASASGDDPRQARVILTTNDANSYLATTIGEQAAKTIRTSIVKTVNEQAAQQFLMGLATIRDNLVEARDGANKLVDGAATAVDGATTLADGNATLADGTASLRDGLGTLASGAATLPEATRALADGASQVAAGNAQLAGIGDEIGSVAQTLVNDVPALRSDLQTRLAATGLDQTQIDEVLAALDPLNGDVQNGNTQLQGAVARIDALADGSSRVASGASRLADAAPTLVAGINSAAAGSATIADGAAQLRDGSATLRDGLGTLHDGLVTLRDGLASGVDRIPETTEDSRALQAETIADPVDLETSAVTSAGTYGAGLTPFFVCLAAWIGIYALFLIVKPVSRRAITALHSPIKITLAGWLTPAMIGALQMAGLFFVVSVALSFDFENPLGSFALMAFTSVTFAAIILALNVWLGSVGQFVGLVLMVLQLVTAGGTFPWQTLPEPLAWLHHLLPMSYAVDGMRQLMYGGNPAAALTDAGVLALWLIVALVLAGIGVTRMTHVRTLRDLQPSLIG